jgi:hypothetical protein
MRVPCIINTDGLLSRGAPSLRARTDDSIRKLPIEKIPRTFDERNFLRR